MQPPGWLSLVWAVRTQGPTPDQGWLPHGLEAWGREVWGKARGVREQRPAWVPSGVGAWEGATPGGEKQGSPPHTHTPGVPPTLGAWTQAGKMWGAPGLQTTPGADTGQGAGGPVPAVKSAATRGRQSSVVSLSLRFVSEVRWDNRATTCVPGDTRTSAPLPLRAAFTGNACEARARLVAPGLVGTP